MSVKRIGIIGGSGLYNLPNLAFREWLHLSTPFGDPSDLLGVGEIDGRELVFLPRHGRGHRFLPSEINFRANIHALKQLNVKWILSVSAVGSFKKEIKPLDIVLVDQFIDLTYRRVNTFFGDGLAAHIAFDDPVCQTLRRTLYEAGQEEGLGARIHWGGTYLGIEGPAFSSKAESLLHQSWGCSVVGMTNPTEAKLAREAEICYATLAMVTDYDSWVEDRHSRVSVRTVLENLGENSSTAERILRNAIHKIVLDETCGCHHALQDALVTAPASISPNAKSRLDWLIGKTME
ncbi:MAG TPA: S-methyl-5'-thioadenosine phosphorylase [bacterium]